MKIRELIEIGTQSLKERKIEDSNIKARILLQYVLQKNNQQLVIDSNEEVAKEKMTVYLQYIQELIQGKPLQYITNTQEFMGLNFYVDENVLIPQPDTEILVEKAIKVISEKIQNNENKREEETKHIQNQKECNKTIKILDLCTGSGAIAVSLAKKFQDSTYLSNIQERNIKAENRERQLEVYATDISKEALKIAEKNAKENGVEVTFFLSNMFEQIKLEFDIIVSNPPYIESKVIKTLSKEVQNEPHIALDGGEDGLDFYRIIANEGYKFLSKKRLHSIGDRI